MNIKLKDYVDVGLKKHTDMIEESVKNINLLNEKIKNGDLLISDEDYKALENSIFGGDV